MTKHGWRWVAASVGWLLAGVVFMGMLVPSILDFDSIGIVAQVLIIIVGVCVIVPLVAGVLLRLAYGVGRPPVLAPWLLGLAFVALTWLAYRQPRLHTESGQWRALLPFAMWVACSFSIEVGGRLVTLWRRRRTRDSRPPAAEA